jgi:hypothetical protein
VVDLFPRVFTEEMNDILLAKISEEEVLCTLKAFQKRKSLGPDGLTG